MNGATVRNLGSALRRLARAMGFGAIALAATASFAQAQDWPGKADWDKTVAAAKKEGKVVVSGPVGNTWREALTSFEKDYGIKVEFTSANGADFWPRYIQEQKLGKSLWDLRISAPDTNSYELLAQGDKIADVRSMLVLPEVTADKNWVGGYDSIYSDKAKKYFVGFGLVGGPLAWVNRDFVSEAELSNMSQLNEDRFKGKVTTLDWRGGSASNNFALLLSDKRYGANWLRDLIVKNEIVVTNNNRQQIDWLIRGNYPIAIGVTSNILFNMKETGLAQNVVPLDGPRKYSSSFGGLIAFQKPPNPNAAKVYANWIMSQKGQATIAKLANYNSRRTDVEPGEAATVVDLSKIDDYVNTQSEEMLPAYDAWREFARTLKQP
ncbi:MAG TPA: extracellular solute-binding protein [Alphaproteobacteria bacterium]